MPSWFPYPIRYVGDCGISGRGYSMRGNLAALHELGITREQIDIMPWPPTMSLQEDWFFDRTEAGATVLAARAAMRDAGVKFPIWFYMTPGQR